MNQSITTLKGIGEKTEKIFHKAGIETIDDLLHYYPRSYDKFQEPVPIADLEAGRIQAVCGMLTKDATVKRVRNLQIINAVIRDETGILQLTWFNMPYMRSTLKAGSRYVFRGKTVKHQRGLAMEQPIIYRLDHYEEQMDTLRPIYPLVNGLTNKLVTGAVKQALEMYPMQKEYLPEPVRREYRLAEYNFAVQNIHFPKSEEDLLYARRRLVFDEFLVFILTVRRMKDQQDGVRNGYVMKECSSASQLLEKLPYQLTNAQKKVWDEIRKDLAGEYLMNRLIQGDVGSGKTIIAVLAMLTVADYGYQSAMMAPTEVLARQHYESVNEMMEKYGIARKAVLLTGSMTAKEKKLAYTEIAEHRADIVIGTHALIQEKVVYDKLALVITDEQHRFGVHQREVFSEKGLESEKTPHVLVMSATPIPRTLAIILYGDLDISIIDELPANRLPIKNCVVGTDYRDRAYRFIENEIQAGRQAYVICPMVEESDMVEAENVIEYTEKLRRVLPPAIRVEYLHGKMRPKEKNEVMERFAANEIQVLVSTTVVEVGVNVPNATVMMVENAERFGLAQLHQLRGRVGRGEHQSYCIFVNGNGGEDTGRRLEILNKSNDGFFIASEDLKLRGPGDFFGIRQSGMMEFAIGDIFTDANILKETAEAAERILKADPDLESEENAELGRRLREYWTESMDKLAL